MRIETNNLLFIDIETVSAASSFTDLSDEWQVLWKAKTERQQFADSTPEAFYEDKASLYAEFGQIVCISLGYFYSRGEEKIFRIKSVFGNDERKILVEFCQILHQFNKTQPGWAFAGHNIKEFDLPYLSRRLLMNGLGLPEGLDFLNLKPWEFTIVDTLQIWKFGEFRNFTSLALLAAALNVPSPKTEMDGSRVGPMFWKGEYQRIADYCQQDVTTVANIIQRLNQEDILSGEKIEIV